MHPGISDFFFKFVFLKNIQFGQGSHPLKLIGNLDIPFWRLIVFFAVILTIFLRAPSLLLEPRLWAEEGELYFAYSYHLASTPSWYMGFIQIPARYLSLWSNIAVTFAANFVSLETVPFVTTGFALIVQLLPITIILWGDSSLWRSPIKKILCILVVLFVPLSGEIWLVSMHSQFVFALVTFLILHSNTDGSKPIRWFYRVVLVFAGLTGVTSCLLTIFFIVKAYIEKSKERSIQSIILGVCSLIQALVVILGPVTLRGPLAEINWRDLSVIPWTQTIAFTIFGYPGSYGSWYLFEKASHLSPLYFNLLTMMIIFLEMLFFLFLFFFSKPSLSDRITLLGSYLFLICFSMVGALPEPYKFFYLLAGKGQRYFYTPNAILMIMVVVIARAPKGILWIKGERKNILLILILTLSIMWGVTEFYVQSSRIASDKWPKWQDEVSLWRKNPNHLIKIWPPGWKMKLNK